MDYSGRVKQEEHSRNNNPLQNINHSEKVPDSPIEAGPSTSGYCHRVSREEKKDLRDLASVHKTEAASLRSTESFLCRICHNNENAEKLISPCSCRGSLATVHVGCLERWISTSRCTTCELCQFQYNTEQTLRYTLYESLRLWYNRSMSRRALQEDCQMCLLLTLIAFGIVGTLLVAVQYYILKGEITSLGRVWTKGWLIVFVLITLVVYLINVYMIVKSQLTPWYRWWQSAYDIRLILENRNLPSPPLKQKKTDPKTDSAIEAIEEETGSRIVKLCDGEPNGEAELKNYEVQPQGQYTPQTETPI